MITQPKGTKQYTARILHRTEVQQLIDDLPDSPLAIQGIGLAEYSGALLVFEDPATGKIVAHWPLMLAWHAEPCYIHPDYRGGGDLINQMIEGLQLTMHQLDVPLVFANTADPAVKRILAVLGFQLAPGEMYYAYAAAPPASAGPQEPT